MNNENSNEIKGTVRVGLGAEGEIGEKAHESGVFGLCEEGNGTNDQGKLNGQKNDADGSSTLAPTARRAKGLRRFGKLRNLGPRIAPKIGGMLRHIAVL